jgi:hypothetical protein
VGRLIAKLERREGVRRIYMDIMFGDVNPKRGNYIQAFGKHGPGASYKILIARQVQRRVKKAPPRFTLIVRKIPEIPKSAPFIFELSWYSRKKKKSKLLSPLDWM